MKSRATRQEFPWTSKAIFIFFHLHPLLANEKFEVTSAVFGINMVTLNNWLRKPERVQKWLGLI